MFKKMVPGSLPCELLSLHCLKPWPLPETLLTRSVTKQRKLKLIPLRRWSVAQLVSAGRHAWSTGLNPQYCMNQAWRCSTVFSALRRWKPVGSEVQGQPQLHREFETSLGRNNDTLSVIMIMIIIIIKFIPLNNIGKCIIGIWCYPYLVSFKMETKY